MRRVSARAQSWKPYKARERQAVVEREPQWTCEGCGKKTAKLQLAHIFGRRNIVGEPWASSRYLTMHLCFYDFDRDKIGCHEKIDQYLDPYLRDRLEDVAARRLWEAFGRPYPEALAPDGAVRLLASQQERLDPDSLRQVLHVA